jgi:hypothetical protein
MDHGSVYRRCGRRDEATGRLPGARCPDLRSPEHGSWYFSADLPSAAGERRRVRRGGFRSQEEAIAALGELSSVTGNAEPELLTGEWLRRWLASRVSLCASTARSYAAHIRGYLAPYLRGIPLTALTTGDVQAMFTAIIRDETALGRPVSAATLHRIHATLRAALNGAVRAGPLARTAQSRPVRPQVWTPPADRALAARRPAAGGRGVDRRPDGAVPAARARVPAVRAVPPRRAARAAARRGRRAAMERPRPGHGDADREGGSCSNSADGWSQGRQRATPGGG